MWAETGIGGNVGNDHRLPGTHSPPACAFVLGSHGAKVFQEIEVKATLGSYGERAGLRVEELDVAKVGAADGEGHGQEFPESVGESTGKGQVGALHKAGGIRQQCRKWIVI